MPAAKPRAPSAPEYEGLAQDLAALAYPLRLALLDALHVPLILSDIQVRPWKADDSLDPDRPAAKQTVLSHLERLGEKGLVKLGTTERAGKVLTTYAANPQRLYSLSEDLRLLVQRHAGHGAAEDQTGTMTSARPAAAVPGARVVVVHGAYQGRSFPLDGAPGSQTRWTVGRAPDVEVSLDYDPFVSARNSEIRRAGEVWEIVDLGGKNGTQFNWRALPREGSAKLATGDIIGVGRSLLVFYMT